MSRLFLHNNYEVNVYITVHGYNDQSIGSSPRWFKGDIFREKNVTYGNKSVKKIRETHTNVHSRKSRIVQVLTNNM